MGHGVSQMFKQHLEVTKYLPQNLNPNPNPFQKIDFTQLDVALLKKCSNEIPQEKQMKNRNFPEYKKCKTSTEQIYINIYVSGGKSVNTCNVKEETSQQTRNLISSPLQC